MPETCSRLSSDGEDDVEEDKDRDGYSHIPYHPRPAAVSLLSSLCDRCALLIKFLVSQYIRVVWLLTFSHGNLRFHSTDVVWD